MAVSKELKKDSQSGTKVSSVSSPKKDSVIVRVGFYLKNVGKRKVPKYIFKIPKSKPVGSVLYTVQSAYDPVTFTRYDDALHFRALLSKSVNDIKSDIVRREITEEGFEPTY